MPATRSYVTGHFMMQLDGVKCGFLTSVDGGGVTAEVVNEAAGPDFFVKKHIGAPKYEDLVLQFRLPLELPVYDWIAASWKANYQRKNGSITAADYNFNAKQEREFFNALITETAIPACDAASKEPAYLSMTLAPELIRNRTASGKVGGPVKAQQKAWLSSNFRLKIDGLDCTRVKKVDSFKVTQRTVGHEAREMRDYAREPGKLEFPNLRITISEAGAQSWIDWHENFVIEGKCSDADEKHGSLELLAPNRQDLLLAIQFFNLGIFRLTPGRAQSGKNAQAEVVAELYCERMELGAAKAGAPPKQLVVSRALSSLSPIIKPTRKK
jgi:hypothetical protein